MCESDSEDAGGEAIESKSLRNSLIPAAENPDSCEIWVSLRCNVRFSVSGRCKAAEGNMGAKIEVTRLELSASQLRRVASRSSDGRLACRILAIALVLEGSSRAEAASACGMDRQTLRDWVHRYNHDGVGGLSDAHRSGRPPALSAEQMQDLKDLVLAGPDLAIHGVTRWRCLDLSAAIADRYGVVVHERTVGKILRRMGLTRLQPRPYHPQKDGAAQEAFKKTSQPS